MKEAVEDEADEEDEDSRTESKANGEEDMEHENESEEEWMSEKKTKCQSHKKDLKELYIYFHFIFMLLILLSEQSMVLQNWGTRVEMRAAWPPASSLHNPPPRAPIWCSAFFPPTSEEQNISRKEDETFCKMKLSSCSVRSVHPCSTAWVWMKRLKRSFGGFPVCLHCIPMSLYDK